MTRAQIKAHLEEWTESTWTEVPQGLTNVLGYAGYAFTVTDAMMGLGVPFELVIKKLPNKPEMILVRC